MPRVAKSSRNQLGAGVSGQNHSPLKIPFNDDRQERAIRLQSRQALHDIQINQIKAAASPMRKASQYDRTGYGSPGASQGKSGFDNENVGQDGMLSLVPGHSMTPMKRMPILANFEEWMKMATDNKINATNSWNFALIDYFHDMSLLKEGDGVNFQKASCTLDGCVKIYTSRVDSVATETGKLLSGLADSTSRKPGGTDEGEGGGLDEGDGDDGDGEEGSRRKPKKKTHRSSEATLALNFAQLQLRKFELEFAVDPLFKKASADFDEGGAKGLLLNHLAIDSQGRIVCDSGDDANPTEKDSLVADTTAETEDYSKGTPIESTLGDSNCENHVDLDIGALGNKYFPNVWIINDHDICPSLKHFDWGDPNASPSLAFLKDGQKDENILLDSSPILDSSNDDLGIEDDDAFNGGMELATEAGFGEGGEAWAKNVALEPLAPVNSGTIAANGRANDSNDSEPFNINGSVYGSTLSYGQNLDERENILSYFDKALVKNWAGPEHWRIKRIKDNTRVDPATPDKRKRKDPFQVEFTIAMDKSALESIHTLVSSSSAISLPKAQWKSKTRNLLPDDKHFTSKQFMRLFLKPRARMGSMRSRRGVPMSRAASDPHTGADETYWASQSVTDTDYPRTSGSTSAKYGADFFQDDGLVYVDGPPEEEDEFSDAREIFSPEAGAGDQVSQGIATNTLPPDQDVSGTFGSQLVTQTTRLRPEYVQYARVAKKVDVRRLKEEMWKGIRLEDVNQQAKPDPKETNSIEPEILHFTNVMNGLQHVYPRQAMADISTSYCFICLLHLANEKGLRLANEGSLEELTIQRDLIF